MKNDYEFKIEGGPDYSMLTVDIPADEKVRVEASSMAAMDTNLKMKTTMKGGFGRMLSGESLFINEFTAQQSSGEIKIAPRMVGDIQHHYLEDGEKLFLQSASFLASGPNIVTDYKWDGVKGFFSGAGLFLIKCDGAGDVWFNSYGGAIPINIDNGRYVVDNNHIVGFTGGLDYRIRSIGGYKSLFFSGEGLVCEFSGSGTVWIQARKMSPLTSFLDAYRPVEKKSND
jgi:uncharacterized protein (TIGR00266 family)